MQCVSRLLLPALLVALSACSNAGRPATPTATAGAPSTGSATSTASPEASPSPTSGAAGPLSMDGVYRRVLDSLSLPGMVYRVAIHTALAHPATAPAYSPSASPESDVTLWLDASRSTARRELASGQGRYVTITNAGGQFTLGPDGNISVGDGPECPGGSIPAAAVLDCPNATFETYTFTSGGAPQANKANPTITVQPGEYEGQPAVVLVASKRVQPYRSGLYTETRTLYLDLVTLLPRAMTVERESSPAMLSTYQYETVPATTVPADFFDPTTLRFERPDPEATLDEPPLSYTLYWLGKDFAGGGDVPPLTLWHASRYNPSDRPWDGDQVILEYTRQDDPYGQTRLVRLTEYTRTTWDTLPPNSFGPADHCWTQEQIALPGGSATVFSGFDWPDSVPPGPNDPCPTDRPRDRFFAHMFLGDTVIVVDMWSWDGQTRSAIETLVRGLQPGVP